MPTIKANNKTAKKNGRKTAIIASEVKAKPILKKALPPKKTPPIGIGMKAKVYDVLLKNKTSMSFADILKQFGDMEYHSLISGSLSRLRADGKIKCTGMWMYKAVKPNTLVKKPVPKTDKFRTLGGYAAPKNSTSSAMELFKNKKSLVDVNDIHLKIGATYVEQTYAVIRKLRKAGMIVEHNKGVYKLPDTAKKSAGGVLKTVK